jgi:hypothetical protein
MRSILGAAAVAILLSACAVDTQLSSGASYLEGYDRYVAQSGAAGAAKGEAAKSLNAKVREAAAVEPHLRFPARIGLARIEYGRLAPVPPAEGDAWLALAGRLSPWVGEFVPISPLVASFALAEVAPGEGPNDEMRHYYPYERRYEPTDRVVQQIRLGAARQHVDYVLVYEVLGDSRDDLTPLSVLDLSIVGMFLVPSRSLEATSSANAILIDVRNGYPYGTARGTAEDSRLSPNAGSTDRRRALFQRTKTAAVVDLAKNVEAMARELYAQAQQQSKE